MNWQNRYCYSWPVQLLKAYHIRFEHPYWKQYPGEPGTHWGPLWGLWWCEILDRLTFGECHD